MEKKYSMFIGIDVSKNKLDVCLLSTKDSKTNHFIISNNEKGIKKMIQFIKKQKQSLSNCLFCFENTGIYSMPLCFCLAQMEMNYCVVPAYEIKCSKGVRRGKSDKNDSKDIAFYAFTNLHKLQLSKIPQNEIMELKLLFTEREKLIKALKMMGTTSELNGFMPSKIINETLKINAKTITYLKKILKQLESKMLIIIEENEKIKSQINLIKSIPGMGTHTALYLVMTTKCFESFNNWRKLACYAGIAPRSA